MAIGHVAALDFFPKMEERYFEVFNLGTGKGHTVLELVRTFENVTGTQVPIRISGRRPGDVAISYASVKKANDEMGWKARFSLDDCLRDAWRFKKQKQ